MTIGEASLILARANLPILAARKAGGGYEYQVRGAWPTWLSAYACLLLARAVEGQR